MINRSPRSHPRPFTDSTPSYTTPTLVLEFLLLLETARVTGPSPSASASPSATSAHDVRLAPHANLAEVENEYENEYEHEREREREYEYEYEYEYEKSERS